MKLRELPTISERRALIEKLTSVQLKDIAQYSIDDTTASKKNCENMIGIIQVPLGIVGPLRLRNSAAVVERYVPLATTEGALVASVNRGCRAISESGGADVLSSKAGATRGPVFKLQNMRENSALYDFVIHHENEIKKIAEQTSHHLSLVSIDTKSTGLYRFFRFYFDTSDAMGLNMVTIATDAIVRFIEDKTGFSCVSLSGNFCVDKKASWQNFVNNRGHEVWAEVLLPEAVVDRVLKTTPESFYATWLSKCMIGSAMTGSMGFNAQYANVLAALFIATGQDPAHVAECSIGITTAELKKNGLYVSVYLPDLMVGTVGGGTGLGTQKEALSILGVDGGDDGKNSTRFAEIVGATVLAGEISLLASLSEKTLAHAHKTYARGGGS